MIKYVRLSLAILSLASFIATPAMAWDSAFVAPSAGFSAQDVAASTYFGGYDVSGNEVVGFTGGNLGIYDFAGSLVTGLGNPTDYFAAYSNQVFNSFVRLDPSGNSAWVGFSVIGNSDDRIYQVDFSTSTWTSARC
ncbi:MAG: hypothetical protein U1D30_09560 [Planctomycetota bacterium]